MLKKFKYACLPFVAAASLAAAEGPYVKTQTVLPEFVFSKGSFKGESFRVDSKGYWAGASFNQEFFRPNGLYSSTDVTGLWGSVSSKCRVKERLPGLGDTFKSRDYPFFGNLESRIGYIYLLPYDQNISIVPFGGLGLSHFMPSNKSLGSFANGLYAVLGVRSFYQFNPEIKVGLGIKVSHTFGFRVVSENKKPEYIKSHAKGYEVGLPVCWKPEKLKSWAFEVEPRIFSPNWGKQSAQFGMKFSCGFKY